MDSLQITVNDKDIQFMERELLKSLQSSKYFKCLYLGVACEELHLVDVPPLAGVSNAMSHEDLDVFLWLPGVPHVCRTYVNVSACRHSVRYCPEGLKDNVIVYTFIHYDQAIEKVKTCHVNKLIDGLVGGLVIPWYGDILVVKSKGKNILNMTKADQNIATGILTELLTSGGLA